jgi:DNA invertase Pin-like site-specific DNA recombinase
MKNVIIYTRVSTDEQAEKGFSLRHQKEQLENYCNQNGYTIMAHFQDDYSAKNFSARPEFQKLLRFAKANQNKVDTLLFLKWDRFSRNIEAAYRMIREFKEMGIEVNSMEQPLDLSQPDSKVLLAVYLVIPEIENDKNSLRTIDGLRKAQKEGCFTGIAPKGYINCRNSEGKSTLTFDPVLGPLIQSAFMEYAKGIYSAEQVRLNFLKKGLKISRNGFLGVLKNPTYMGKIYIKPYKKEEEMIVEGLHPCIVSPEVFEKVQLILKGKYKAPVRTLTEIDQALPLRGFLVCPECGKLLTGSGSKGRDGKNTYFYYHCTRYCKTRHKAIEVNALFEKLLCEMKIEQEQESVYTSLLSERFSERHQDKQTLIQSLKREEENLYKRLEMAEDHLFEKQIDASAFNTMKNRIDNRLSEIKIELKEMGVKERFFEKHLKEGITFLKGVDTVYKDSSTELKKKIVQTLFCQKLEYHQWYFSTPTLEESIKTILFKDRRLERLRITDKKKNIEGVVVG